MPLDHVHGESIGTLGVGHVVPINKWDDTAFFEMACSAAARAFKAKGAYLPIHFSEGDVLVMEYPHMDRLAFVFCRQVAGQEVYVPYVIKLTPPVISELVNANRWQRPN